MRVHPVEEGAVAGACAVRPARAFDLDHGSSRPGQQLTAQRARPHGRQIGNEQTSGVTRASSRSGPTDSGRGGVGLPQGGGRDVEQFGSFDDGGLGTRCGPPLQRSPWVVGHLVGPQQRGDRIDIVRARQCDCEPAVGGREQPGGATRRDPAPASQPEQTGPPGQQGGRVGGNRFGASQNVGARKVGRPAGQTGQVGQPTTSPLAGPAGWHRTHTTMLLAVQAGATGIAGKQAREFS